MTFAEFEKITQFIHNAGPGVFPAGISFFDKVEYMGRVLGTHWAHMTASVAPMWRWVQIKNVLSSYPTKFGPKIGEVNMIRGASRAATLQGVGALGIAGVCIAVAAGVYMALGAGYMIARERVMQRGFMAGFARGYVMGVLGWKWNQASARFTAKLAYINHADPVAGQLEAKANNEALFIGFCLGISPPAEGKKQIRINLRRAASRVDDGAWSRDPDRARLQQIDYVTDLANAGLAKGLIVAT